MHSPMKRRYGWAPDLPDVRDDDYAVPHRSIGSLPVIVDLRAKCSPVEDQGQLGSCTGNAIAGLLEYRAIQAGKPCDYSRLFIYYQERVLEHTVKVDAGASIRDGMKACAKLGAPLESLWPYDVTKFARKPPVGAYTDAAKRKIAAYHSVPNLDTMRAELAATNPVVFGFTVYESFESDAVAKTGVVPMPKRNERALGGHAVLAVGYDDTKHALLVRNSWGADWGLHGYFWMPYGYVLNPNLADDFWTA